MNRTYSRESLGCTSVEQRIEVFMAMAIIHAHG